MADINSSLPIRTQNAGDVIVRLGDKTVPSQQLAIDALGNASVILGAAPFVKLQDGTGTSISSQANGTQRALDVGINVAGVQVDPRSIRALTVADVVSAAQGTAASIANAWTVKPTDGTNSQGYTAASEAKVSVTQPLPAGANLIGTVNSKLQDGAGTAITSQVNGTQRALDVGVNVAGVQVDPRSIRALLSTDVVTANIKDSTGAAFSAVNPLPVSIQSTSVGTEVNDYNTVAAVAASAVSNHDYTITSLKTLKVRKIWATASDSLKIEVQISPDGSVFTTKFVGFNSASQPSISIDLDNLTMTESGVGSKIRIIRTNRAVLAQDVYSTISGLRIS